MRAGVKYWIMCVGSMLLFALQVVADEREDIKAMNKAYRDTKNYSMEVEMQLFNEQGKMLKTTKGFIRKMEMNYATSILGKQTVYNTSGRIIIDEQEKIMIYADPLSPEYFAQMNNERLLSDSLLFSPEATYTYIRKDALHTSIQITEKEKGEYDKIEITLNSKTHFLEEVVYYYNQSIEDEGEVIKNDSGISKIIVRYNSIKINAKIDGSVFSEKMYLENKAGKLTGVGKYSSFTVVDQRKKSGKTTK